MELFCKFLAFLRPEKLTNNQNPNFSFDVMDNEANYEVMGKYQGQNERHANVAIQINASLCSGKCLGTKTADLYEGFRILKRNKPWFHFQ